MDDETIRGLVRESFPKLLQGPFRSWVGRHVALQNTTRSELEDDHHVEQLELGCDCNHEVTSDHCIDVVAYECRPALGRSCFPVVSRNLICLNIQVLCDRKCSSRSSSHRLNNIQVVGP